MKAILAGLITCAVFTAACGQRPVPLTEKEKTVASEMTANLTTRCVGRYLIDLPANVVPRGRAKFEDVIVESEPKTLRQFEREMDALGAELKKTKSSLGYQFLYEDGDVRGIEHTRYFISLGDYGASSDAVRVIEAYKWDRGYQVRATLEAADCVNAD